MAPNDTAASPNILPGVTSPDGRTIGDEILNVEDVSLAFGGVKALSNVSFNVFEGEVRAIIGPNGAGKTTLISIICGLTSISSGVVSVGGFDVIKDYRKTRALNGHVPQELMLEPFETVWETVSL